jgi:hypothetical protein
VAVQLALDASHDLTISQGRLQLVEDTDSIAQSLKTRLRLVRGEYFADLEQGIPYLTHIMVKGPKLDLVRSILVEAVAETPGVVEVTEFLLTLDQSTRALLASGKCRINTNDVVSFANVKIDVV